MCTITSLSSHPRHFINAKKRDEPQQYRYDVYLGSHCDFISDNIILFPIVDLLSEPLVMGTFI